MKLTKTKLKQIIREEFNKVLKEEHVRVEELHDMSCEELKELKAGIDYDVHDRMVVSTLESRLEYCNGDDDW